MTIKKEKNPNDKSQQKKSIRNAKKIDFKLQFPPMNIIPIILSTIKIKFKITIPSRKFNNNWRSQQKNSILIGNSQEKKIPNYNSLSKIEFWLPIPDKELNSEYQIPTKKINSRNAKKKSIPNYNSQQRNQFQMTNPNKKKSIVKIKCKKFYFQLQFPPANSIPKK